MVANFRTSGKLTLRDFDQLANIKDNMSSVLDLRVTAGEYYLLPNDQPITLLIPVKETFTHGGGGDETFDVSHRIVDSHTVGDDQTATTNDESTYEVVSIDYVNQQVTVNSTSATEFTLYYLGGDGVADLVYVPPVALGQATKKLMSKSFFSINAKNQYNRNSQLRLERPFIIPEKHRLQLQVNTSADVGFPDNGKVGDIDIPFKSMNRTNIKPGTEQKIINSVTQN